MDKTRLPENLCRVYEYMDNNKEVLLVLDASEMSVWRGFARDISEALDLPTTSVYNIIARLIDLGSLTRIRHGAAKTPSVYRIDKEPDDYQYTLNKEMFALSTELRSPTKYERMQDSVTRLTNRVNELERRVKELERNLLELSDLLGRKSA